LQKTLENFPQRKTQTKIINHKKNCGSSAAQNTSIENATGEYIYAVDSDDYLENNAIELLVKEAMANDAEITVSDLQEEYSNGKSVLLPYKVTENQEENRLNAVLSVNSPQFLCGKLFKRSLFENKNLQKPFEGMNYWEDRILVTQLTFFANKIAKVDKPLYHYVKYNSNAITYVNKNRMHFESAIYFWNFLEKFLQKHGFYEKFKDAIDFAKVKHKASMMISTDSTALRKEFAPVFYEEETKYYPKLRKGKRIITFLIRHKLFFCSQIYHKGVKFINKI